MSPYPAFSRLHSESHQRILLPGGLRLWFEIGSIVLHLDISFDYEVANMLGRVSLDSPNPNVSTPWYAMALTTKQP